MGSEMCIRDRINMGTDVIHRTFPVADAFSREDSDCIRLKELN